MTIVRARRMRGLIDSIQEGSLMNRLLQIGLVIGALALANGALGAPTPTAPRVAANGTITTPGFAIPYSSFASPKSLKLFLAGVEAGRDAPPLNGPIAASRAYYGKINRARVRRMRQLFAVTVRKSRIAGVVAYAVAPRSGVAPANEHRVLLNLHGGAFLWSADSGGLVEAIPIAAVGRIKVITINYRQGPEHVFPAGSEDVAAVYRVLLEHYKPGEIGIYGTSAGGILTAEAIAWFEDHGLPLPGAIGTFCGSVMVGAGDSAYLAPMLNGGAVPAHPLSLSVLPYFKGARMVDPEVLPGVSRKVLARFPPTLLITGTRDFLMSSEIQSANLLTQAGIDAELHVWNGMWHAFFVDPDMPESMQAYRVVAQFFVRHLTR
ncbi:MAG: alpha/beta hydrolase [Steroidobacteraceae bacterium]